MGWVCTQNGDDAHQNQVSSLHRQKWHRKKNRHGWEQCTSLFLSSKQKLLRKSDCLSSLTMSIIGDVNLLGTENEYHSFKLPKLFQRDLDALPVFHWH